MKDFLEWRHAFKLDPAKELDDEALERVCESGTDGIIVGGTDGVTLDNVLAILMRIRRFSVPVLLEVSDPDAITPGFDGFLIPSVLNTDDARWIKGHQHAAIREFGELMDFEEVIPEGYVILNPDCKAAKLTGADAAIGEEDILAYARMAEHFFRLPVLYLEYSGTYGDPETVRAAAGVLHQTRLVYGGGIRGPEQAAEMAAHADLIVVGNALYDNLAAALKTVRAGKKTDKMT